MKIWVTKYALTTGIFSADAEVNSGVAIVPMFRVPTQYFHGNDWHETPEAALARAEEMRKKRIIALNRNIAKLQNLEFKA